MAGNDSYTKLLIHADGDNNSTSFVDDSASIHIITPHGDAKISTTQSKFGGSSAYLDGTGDYLSIPASQDWNFGTGNFTIDFWFLLPSFVSGTYPMFESTALTFYFGLGFDYGSTYIYANLNGTELGGNVTYYNINTWHHFALVRNGTSLKIYFDGGYKTGNTISAGTSFDLSGNAVNIGKYSSTYVNGYIDEFRISKGIERWTSNFTPESSAYSPYSMLQTVSSLSFDSLLSLENSFIFNLDVDLNQFDSVLSMESVVESFVGPRTTIPDLEFNLTSSILTSSFNVDFPETALNLILYLDCVIRIGVIPLVDVLIGTTSVVNYFKSISMKFSDSAYCFSIDLEGVSQDYWSLFDPKINYGLLNLSVDVTEGPYPGRISDGLNKIIMYQFLCEERDTDITNAGINFKVWGRSAQALLDIPYSTTLTDTTTTYYPWQTSYYVKASVIVKYAYDHCCSVYAKSKTYISWQAYDFLVYKGSFSTSNDTPISITAKLAAIIGAQLVPQLDGGLIVKPYSVIEETVIESFTDVDDIVALSDAIGAPLGYNSVDVFGYIYTPPPSVSQEIPKPYVSVELIPDGLKWGYFTNRVLRCRFYGNNAPSFGVINGHIIQSTSTVESITEIVTLNYGVGHTSKPNRYGETLITGSTSLPFEIRQVTYSVLTTHYNVYSYLNENSNPNQGMFWFIAQTSTDSATTTLYFQYEP